VSDDDAAPPDRLRQRLLEEGFVNRVVWIKLEVSLFGGHPRFRKLLPKWKDELLIASLQEYPVYCAEMAALFEGDDLALVIERVRSSGDVFAVKALAKSRPESRRRSRTNSYRVRPRNESMSIFQPHH
jgi:hypothetical protein